MNSRLLHFLCVLACAALIGLGPARAQKIAATTDSNGSAVTAPARQSDASHAAVAPGSSADANNVATKDSQDAAHAAVANDRGTVAPNQGHSSTFDVGWIGLVGLFGLLGLVRRNRSTETARRDRDNLERDRTDYPRAA